jgi:transcriptional regulator with XRE-family HTH domain
MSASIVPTPACAHEPLTKPVHRLAGCGLAHEVHRGDLPICEPAHATFEDSTRPVISMVERVLEFLDLALKPQCEAHGCVARACPFASHDVARAGADPICEPLGRWPFTRAQPQRHLEMRGLNDRLELVGIVEVPSRPLAGDVPEDVDRARIVVEVTPRVERHHGEDSNSAARMDEDTRKDGSVSGAFGKQFERLREACERSRIDLAESSGVELDVIEQIERGDGGSVNLDTLRKLAGALGLSLCALFEGIGDERIASGPFGPRLAELRERRGWSRAQLAESSGLDVDAIEQIECEQHSPGLAELRRLAGALELRLSQLFEDPEP